MKILGNPILLRAAIMFFCASFSFVLGLIFIRMLRKSITEEANISSGSPLGSEAMPMHVYNTVIHELNQQKNKLQEQTQAELQRTRLNEAVAQAVVSHLSSGVLVFGTNGLVKSSNSAAKEILGFAATAGMGVDDIFRGAVIRDAPTQTEDATPETLWLAEEIKSVLTDGGTVRHTHVEYETPAGVTRDLCLTIAAVPASEGGICAVACLIDDLSELWQLRRQQPQGLAAASAR